MSTPTVKISYRNKLFIAISNTYVNGSQTLTSPELLQAHKIAELSSAEHGRISQNFVELYTKGLSLTDISRQSGKAKNSIRSILLRAGIELRSNISVPVAGTVGVPGKGNIRPYFGFCYFQGQIMPDQREYENLLLIHRLWASGTNPNRIADILNAKTIPARSASAWNRNSVVNIVNRFEQKLIVIKGASYELK